MTANSELNIISQTRAEVLAKNVPTGENLFLVWGYPTAVFLFLEFLALTLLGKDWCQWLWVGIPAVGTPLMMYYLNEDYERTGNRSLNSNVILQMWMFVGFVSFLGGVTMGLANVFAQLYCTFQGVLIGMGCFITGVILHFRSKTLCGIVGTALSFLSLFLQGDLWPWQLLVASAVAVITLIIPGHLFHRYVRNYDK